MTAASARSRAQRTPHITSAAPSSPAPPRWRASRIADACAIAILVVVSAVALMTFRDYGLGWDDYTHAEYGGLLLRLYASGFTDQRALSFVNLYAYGGGFDMIAALAAKILPFGLFETRRLVGAAVGVIGLATTWRIGRRIGGPAAGLIATALLATCPLYYGQMFMNAKDAPFAVAMAVLTLALLRALEQYPAPRISTKVLFGIGLGLSFGSRVIGVLGGFYAFAALALIIAVECRRGDARKAARRAGTFVLRLLPGLLLAYITMALVWPWSVVEPLNPIRALLYFSHFFEHPWRELFDGALILVPDMPRQYVPQLFALTLPEIMLALGIAGIAAALVASARAADPPERRAALLLLVLSATFPILLTVITRPAMYNGIRHFVFVAPPIAALGGLAGGWIVARAAACGRAAALIAPVAIGAAMVPPVVDMARLHPYEYVHFNHLAGGAAAARERYMLDYWGLSFRQAAQALVSFIARNHEAPARHPHWHVAVCGPHRPVQAVLGPGFDLNWDPREAEFVIALGEFYCRRIDAPMIAEVVRDGVTFARVYDIRGRTVTNLLTIPAPAPPPPSAPSP